jgi:Zn finger protein HypA/HybF involved in hydrogenase expression
MTDPDRSGATVADMAAEGVDAVDAFCAHCGNSWLAPISFLPPATTLAKVEALMACPACGGRDVNVSPASGEQSRTVH